jgi:hypothetical protein
MTAATTMRGLCLAWLAVLATFSFTGCGDDHTAFAWAPDGQHAFARGPNGYFIIDGSGHDLGLVTSGEGALPLLNNGTVTSPHEIVGAWMPDSRHVIVERFLSPGSWQEYAQLLGPQRAGSVVRAADQLANLIAASHGELGSNDIDDWYSKSNLSVLGVSQVIYYLDDVRPQVLAPLKRTTHDPKGSCTSGDAASGSTTTLDRPPPCILELRIRDVTQARRSADRLVMHSADEVWWAVPSPKGRAIAVAIDVLPESADSGLQLQIFPLARPTRPVLVSSNAAAVAAWSSDGEDLAYEEVLVPSVEILHAQWSPGALQVRRVCTPSGDVIEHPDPAKSLAAVNAVAGGSIAWLPDGRILFESLPVPEIVDNGSYPTERPVLFAMRVASPQTLGPLIPEKLSTQLPGDTVAAFSVSPDGKKVAVDGANGGLAVFFLDTGILVKLQDPLEIMATRSAPASSWKSADELSYVAGPGDPNGSPDRAEMVIWNVDGSKRWISKTWADVDWLPRPKK